MSIESIKEIINEALDVQNPQKPILVLKDIVYVEYDEWKCPTCGMSYEAKHKYRYCPECGQRINWEGAK